MYSWLRPIALSHALICSPSLSRVPEQANACSKHTRQRGLPKLLVLAGTRNLYAKLEPQVLQTLHLLWLESAPWARLTFPCYPTSKFEAFRSLIAQRHKDMSMLSFILSKPIDALLPQVAINIPNESQVKKACNLLFVKLAFGLCHTFPIHPTAKLEAIGSLIAPRHKNMSMLRSVLSEPGDAFLPQVVMNVPNESQVIKACNLLFVKLAFGLCHTFPIHPTAKLGAIGSLIAPRHKDMSMLRSVLSDPIDALLPQVVIYFPNESQVIKACNLLFVKFAFGLRHTFPIHPIAKLEAFRSLIAP